VNCFLRENQGITRQLQWEECVCEVWTRFGHMAMIYFLVVSNMHSKVYLIFLRQTNILHHCQQLPLADVHLHNSVNIVLRGMDFRVGFFYGFIANKTLK
jgi:hypothetical protein